MQKHYKKTCKNKQTKSKNAKTIKQNIKTMQTLENPNQKSKTKIKTM
jgi:hypothetical protein